MLEPVAVFQSYTSLSNRMQTNYSQANMNTDGQSQETANKICEPPIASISSDDNEVSLSSARPPAKPVQGGLPTSEKERYCLVSVGATTTFRSLVEKVFEPAFISALVKARYNRMIVQCGPDAPEFRKVALQQVDPALRVEVVDYVDDLSQLMRKCRAAGGNMARETGMLISHAGIPVAISSLLAFHALTNCRHRHCLGCHDDQYSHCYCSKSHLAGQPPSRARR